MHVRTVLFAPLLAVALVACAHKPVTAPVASAPTLQGDPAHPGSHEGLGGYEALFRSRSGRPS